jgi:hypothetical protein
MAAWLFDLEIRATGHPTFHCTRRLDADSIEQAADAVLAEMLSPHLGDARITSLTLSVDEDPHA